MHKIECHAEGDTCFGCAHYRGEEDVCEYADVEYRSELEVAQDKIKDLHALLEERDAGDFEARCEREKLRDEIEQLRKKDAAWLKTATGFRVRLVEATDALKNIAAIDYTRAATTGACGLAVRIAKEALTTKNPILPAPTCCDYHKDGGDLEAECWVYDVTDKGAGRDCQNPGCHNSGWYFDDYPGLKGESEALQCEWCWRTDDSKFNLARGRTPSGKAEQGNDNSNY